MKVKLDKNDSARKYIEIGGTQLTFYNYKEPLKAINKKDGYGFYGVMLTSVKGDKIQCHICGELFEELNSHLRAIHKIKAADYKERFELAGKTRLCSEKARLMRRKRFWQMLKDNPDIADKYKESWSGKHGKKNGGGHGKKITLETMNKRGTCPDQLLAKITEIKEKVGHTPSLKEFVHECGTQRYKHLIFKTFGSWGNALKMLQYKQKTVKSGGFKRKYCREELIDYLVLFATDNNRIPTATDCNKGLLPDDRAYIREFGSWEKAREEAGVYELIGGTIEGQRLTARKKIAIKAQY